MSNVVMEERRLRLGARLDVTLQGYGATGFRWGVVVEKPEIIGVARIVEDDPEPRVAGESADEVFELTALTVGETEVLFALARNFEAAGPPREVRGMRVVVTEPHV